MLFFRILHLHSLPLKPVGFKFHTPIRGTCYTLSPLWIEHGAEQAEAQDNLVTWQRRANTTVILVFFKGFCWGSMSQWFPIVLSIDSDWSVCLHWAALNRWAEIIQSFSCVWFVAVTAFCKGHACVAGRLGSGVQRQPHVCSVVLCVLSTVYTLKFPSLEQTEMKKHARRKTLRLNIKLVESSAEPETRLKRSISFCWISLFNFSRSISPYCICSRIHTVACCLSSHRSSLEAAANLALQFVCCFTQPVKKW